jgi:hypothetical protein
VGPKQEIRVALSERKGRMLVDLRLFVRSKRRGWVATQKGCTVTIDQIGELDLAVRKLRWVLEQTPAPA